MTTRDRPPLRRQSTVPAGTPALTIKQPWASLIIEGQKDVENRSRRTLHRGLLFIHAGKGVNHEAMEEDGYLLRDPDNLPSGCLLGTVEVVDCVEDSDSPWAVEGYYHWVLADPRPLRKPVPIKGSLGLWRPTVRAASRRYR